MTLTPGRYVGIEDEEDDGILFEERMENLTGKLWLLMTQSQQLDDRIRHNMADLGFVEDDD